ncbi:MAG: M23 family metallopeptidase [Alphaproteobacteria bacterium]|nr:M23 family metallopeptidase [Alphaproteobacteria bacterium]
MASLDNLVLEKKNSGVNASAVMLFLYSMVVSFALVLVITKNFETEEEIVVQEEEVIEEKAIKEEMAEVISVPEIYEEENVETNNLAPEWEVEVQEVEPIVKVEVLEVKKGDNFIGILQNIGMEYAEALDIVNALKKVDFNVKGLKIGQKIEVTKKVDEADGDLLGVDKLVLEPSVGKKFVVTLDEDEKYVAELIELELKSENKLVEGVITSSLAVAMKNAGVPQSVIGNFINIFAYTVDFRSEIKSGNTFKILFDRKMSPDGRVVKNGDILYAELDLGRSNKIALYRYKSADGSVDYYNSNGLVLKRTLDRKPMEFRSARISSRYGWRKHPILKKRILHSGVDYAAPKGSRIYASGDGVVKRAEWAGGYGKYVVIRHNSEFSTGYAHMNSYAKGIKPGVRVKQGQVIGYVGSTGRSTGPHLHFEIIKNGKKIDPLKVKAATGVNLQGKELQSFKKTVAEINALAEKQVDIADNNVN